MSTNPIGPSDLGSSLASSVLFRECTFLVPSRHQLSQDAGEEAALSSVHVWRSPRPLRCEGCGEGTERGTRLWICRENCVVLASTRRLFARLVIHSIQGGASQVSSVLSKYEYVVRSLQQYHSCPIELETQMLDFGSNHGDCVLGLRDDGYINLHGYDISVAAIDRAETRLDERGIQDKIFFLEASELPNDAYEAAVSTTVLEHVIDLEDVARILSEKLTSDGTFLAWYPPRFGIVEEHAFVPFAHWLPSGPLRVRYCDFVYRRREKAPMNGVECDRFLREECRYRSAYEVRKVFLKYFEEVRFVGLDMLAKRKGSEGSALSRVASRLTKLDPILRTESLFADWVQARLLCRRPRRK